MLTLSAFVNVLFCIFSLLKSSTKHYCICVSFYCFLLTESIRHAELLLTGPPTNVIDLFSADKFTDIVHLFLLVIIFTTTCGLKIASVIGHYTTSLTLAVNVTD